MGERIDCPVCGRPNRTVTKTGMIREHDVPPGFTSEWWWRWCPSRHLTVAEAINRGHGD